MNQTTTSGWYTKGPTTAADNSLLPGIENGYDSAISSGGDN